MITPISGLYFLAMWANAMLSHVAGELHVGHHQNQAAAGALQDELSRFRAFAFDDIDLALLQQQANHIPLHRVVFDNEGRRTKGS